MVVSDALRNFLGFGLELFMHSKRIHVKIPKDANHLQLHVCALNNIRAKTASHIPTLSGHCSSHQHWWTFHTVATSLGNFT